MMAGETIHRKERGLLKAGVKEAGEGRGMEGPREALIERKEEIITILALLENGKVITFCRPSWHAFQNFYCTLCSYLCMAEK